MFILGLAATVVVTMVMATALAHALEMPGKLRLPPEIYVEVQRIYYPGFTMIGVAEVPSAVLLAIAAALSPAAGPAGALRWTAAALTLVAHAVYWLVIHPTNRWWFGPDNSDLDRASAAFFAIGAATGKGDRRRQWEYGHLIRCLLTVPAAVLAMAAMGLE